MSPPAKLPPNARARRLLLGWIAMFAVGVGLATVLHRPPTAKLGAVSTGAPNSTTIPGTNDESTNTLAPSAGTTRTFSVQDGLDSFAVRMSEQDGVRSVAFDAFEATAAGAPGYSVRDKDDGFVVETAGAHYRFKARDEGGLSVRNEAGAVLCRVKLKDDKFNVYGSTGTRTGYGKAKEGRIVLYRENGDKRGAIVGTTDLALAAVLTLPVPTEVRAIALSRHAETLAQ